MKCFTSAVIACSAVTAVALAGEFHGAVSDPQGLAVPGAHVSIRCAGLDESTKSDAQGRFVLRVAWPKDCSLLVKHPGFALFEQRMDYGTLSFQVHLDLAEIRHSIDVSAEDSSGTLLERSINAVSLTETDLRAISNNTEDWVRYAKLVAGATFGSDTIYVDGMPTNTLPPAATVAQITVNADPFSAEYSDGDSTHIDVVTKGSDRTFGLSMGGLSLGAGGHNPLGPGLRSESRSGQGSLTGFIPHLPITFIASLNLSQKLDEQPVLAVLPPSMELGGLLIPSKGSVGNRNLSGSLDSFYVHKNWRAHVSYYDSDISGSNQGVGGIVLPEAGVASRIGSHELRSTVNAEGENIVYRGGIVVSERRTNLDANSVVAGMSVPGAFLDGGSPLTSSESSGTHWTLKSVFQTSSAPSAWTLGLTVSGENDSRLDVPNAAGSFTFSNLQAYSEALAGVGTGTWTITRGTGFTSYSGVTTAPFVQKTILYSRHFLLRGGIRADYQSGFAVMPSPRMSAAADWHGFIFRAGAGLFARDVTSNVFLKAIDNGPAHLQQTIVTGVSLVDDDGSVGVSIPAGGVIHTQLAADLARPRELMEKASIERRVGEFSGGTEYTWTHDRHLLASQRLPDAGGWVDLLDSNRSGDKQRLHSQLRYIGHGQSFAIHYEWVRSRDDTSGPFSFPAVQDDVRAEWARSAGIASHNLALTGNLKLPGGISLIATDAWRGSAPYNITTGLDPEQDGLYTDRGGRARNSGNGPAYNSLSLYGYRRVPIPGFVRKGKRIYLDLGIHVDNILGNKDYTSVGSVAGSPTFRQPLTALPGRAVRFWVNLE
jgi:hypothetical protein